VRNIAHRLKSSQLGSYQGRDFTDFRAGFTGEIEDHHFLFSICIIKPQSFA